MIQLQRPTKLRNAVMSKSAKEVLYKTIYSFRYSQVLLSNSLPTEQWPPESQLRVISLCTYFTPNVTRYSLGCQKSQQSLI